jgi:hypothetical protein
MKRAAVAVVVGIIACCFLLLTLRFLPDSHTDFSIAWNGAKLLLEGRNPYELIGPGREVSYPFTLHYPASTLVAAMPLTLLSERAADLVFVFLSASVLAFVATQENFNRLWIFPSAAFIISARAGQYTPLMAAGYFAPWAAVLLPIKPSTGLAVMGSWSSKRAWVSGGVSAFILLGISFLMLPNWPREWIDATTSSGEYVSPLRKMGGFVLLLALLKWRQREARLLLLLALIPQVSSWYEGLLPMLVGRTKRECQLLSLTSSLGYLMLIPLSFMSPTQEIAIPVVGDMMNAFCYLPALIVVLRRKDEISPSLSASRA